MALTVVDNYSRKCLAIHPGQSIKGGDVAGRFSTNGLS